MNELESGAAFGELALTDKFAKRKATIQCTTNCVFAVLHKKEYNKVLGTLVSKRVKETYTFLQRNPLFVKVSQFYLGTRVWNGETYDRNKVILKEG